MIGRVYRLSWGYWRVVCRWAPPADVGSACCPACGRIFDCPRGCRGVYCGCQGWSPSPPLLRARRQGPRNVLLERLTPVGAGPPEGMVDGELGPLRVVDGFCYRATGQLIVRSFRGLRRLESVA